MRAAGHSIDDVPCFVPFERGRRPSPYVEEALRGINRRHNVDVRAIFAPAHVCNVRGPNNAPIVGSWVIVQKAPYRVPAGHQVRSPGGVVLRGMITVWQILWCAENVQDRVVYDLAGEDGPKAIAHFYRFTSWADDEDAKKASDFDAMATAAMLDSLRKRRESIAARVGLSDIRAIRDEVQTASGMQTDAATAKEIERRSAEVAPRVMEAKARLSVRQSVEDAAELSEALGAFEAPIEGG